MALWIQWIHRGQLSANRSSHLAVLDVNRFHMVVAAAGGPLLACLRKYALFYVSHAENIGDTGQCITDLPIDLDIMVDMSDRAKRMWRITDLGGVGSMILEGSYKKQRSKDRTLVQFESNGTDGTAGSTPASGTPGSPDGPG